MSVAAANESISSADEDAQQQQRETELRSKRICRMCLTQEEPLSDMYSNENRIKSRVPLPLQIMASVSLEVNRNYFLVAIQI